MSVSVSFTISCFVSNEMAPVFWNLIISLSFMPQMNLLRANLLRVPSFSFTSDSEINFDSLSVRSIYLILEQTLTYNNIVVIRFILHCSGLASAP